MKGWLIHSQKKPRLHFGESFTLIVLFRANVSAKSTYCIFSTILFKAVYVYLWFGSFSDGTPNNSGLKTHCDVLFYELEEAYKFSMVIYPWGQHKPETFGLRKASVLWHLFCMQIDLIRPFVFCLLFHHIYHLSDYIFYDNLAFEYPQDHKHRQIYVQVMNLITGHASVLAFWMHKTQISIKKRFYWVT